MSTTTLFYATGKRKNAVAKVSVMSSKTGDIIINNRDFRKYFTRETHQHLIKCPISAVNFPISNYTIKCHVSGGGYSGQAGAAKHAISKALSYFDDEKRAILRHGGFLTRDNRIVERKKYGQPKARKKFQFSKR